MGHQTLLAILFSLFILKTCGQALNAGDRAVLEDFRASMPPLAQLWNPSTNPCSNWPGITCTNGFVTTVQMVNRLDIFGSIPNSVGNLSRLSFLNFEGTAITGTLPNTMGQLSDLQFLHVFKNSWNASFPGITGTIPASLSNCTKLKTFRLYQNSLTGTIPPQLESLTELTEFDINFSGIDGSIPPTLFVNMTKLEKIYLPNGISGTIPDVFWNHLNLDTFDISGAAQLSGTVPRSLSSLPQIRMLRFLFTNVSGCITVPPSATSCTLPPLSRICTCSPSICISTTVCANCSNDFSCNGALYIDGSFCVASSDCASGFCSSSRCLTPPSPTLSNNNTVIQQPPPPASSQTTTIVVAIVLPLLALIIIGGVVAFVVRRYFKDKRQRNDTAALVDMRQTYGTIAASELTVLQELGKGSAGVVNLATYNGEFVAVKTLPMANSSDALEDLLSEADVMRSIRACKNVVKLIGVCRDSGSAAIVMEFCPRGSLTNYLRQKRQLEDYEMWKFAFGIAEGLIALAESAGGIVHRDLSARNVLLTEKLFTKVSDFGFSPQTRNAASTASSSSSNDNLIGPIKWSAPEVLKTGKFSLKSDMWAFGCTLMEIYTCREPYDGFRGNLFELAAAIRDGSYNPLSHLEIVDAKVRKAMPEWMATVMRECFKQDPSERPTPRQVAFLMKRPETRAFMNTYDDEIDDAESLLNGGGFGSASSSSSASTATGSTSSLESANTTKSGKSQSSAASTRIIFQTSAASRIDLLNVQRLGKLGSGSFGAVYLGQSAGAYLALKVLSVDGADAEVLKEADLMMKIHSHRNIIQLYGMIMLDGQLTICMEFAPRGALESLVHHRLAAATKKVDLQITEGLVFRWAVGIARGMAALAASNVIHRDLAVRNILLDSALEPKISDFGLARTVLDPNQESHTKTDVGPIRWFAPECFDLKYSEKSDVWAYGCTLIEIITGEVPFAHLKLMDVVAAVIGRRNPAEIFASTSDADAAAIYPWMLELLKSCFAHEADKRPSFSEIVTRLERVGPTIQEIREAEAAIQKRRERRADIKSMRLK